MKRLLLAVVVLVLGGHSAWAQCCDHCGCDDGCQKVCRVICEVKKVPKVTYDCECEDVCVPGPSRCTIVCDECGNKKKVFTPTCGKVYTRTKVVKHETFEEKCSYKWVVESLCCGCARRCAAADRAAAAANPELAARAATLPATNVDRQPEARQVVFEQPGSNSDATPAVEEAAGRKFDLRRLFGSAR